MSPPYRPEVHPVEYIWSNIKGGYGTRYGDVGFMEYVRSFGGEIREREIDLSVIVDRCDNVAARMEGAGPALFLDDDLSTGAGSGERDSGDDGTFPAIYLLHLRKAVSPTPARLRIPPAKAYSGKGELCRFSPYQVAFPGGPHWFWGYREYPADPPIRRYLARAPI